MNKTDSDEQARRGLIALGGLVVALVALVWWAATSGKETSGGDDAGPEEPSTAAAPDASAEEAAARATGSLARLPDASGELTILTDADDAAIARAIAPEAIAKALDVRHCGPACDAVKKLVADKEHVEIETLKGEDMILPPKETIDTVAPGLSPKERESVHARKAAVVVRVRGDVSPDQVPARTLFALGSLLAGELDGLVYDETTRRIETAVQTKLRAIRVPLGKPVFDPRHIVVHFYRQSDGTARLLTLGMARFGSPDFTLRGATMAAGTMLVDVVNAVAASVVAGKDRLPLTVAPSDVRRAAGEPISIDVTNAERTEGDPDNDVVELLAAEGASRDAWDAAVQTLFGEPARSVEATFDSEMESAAQRARAELPSVLKRLEAGEGELFVWAPFKIPDDEQADGGPEDEWLWVKVASCDARTCTGTLSNRPMYASNIASGKTTSVPRAKIADWLLRLSDGGVAGGATTKIAQERQQPDAGSTQR